MSKDAFTGAGDWPVNEAGRTVTRREIEAMERETPRTFYNTLATARDFVDRAEVYEASAASATDPEQRQWDLDMAAAHRDGDQIGAFRLWQEFGRKLDEALKASLPVGEVTDE